MASDFSVLDENAVLAYEAVLRGLFRQMGLNPESDGLRDTPRRILRAWEEITQALREAPPDMKWFDSEGSQEMVIVRDISYTSMCEHHFFPFVGLAHVAYIPKTKIVGLSKLARITRFYAAKPQTQEHMTSQIADFLFKEGNMEGVCVITTGIHTCMEARGVRTSGASAVTHAIRGTIDKMEVLKLLGIPTNHSK